MPESLLIGLTALQTHKRAMEVTSHNLANATTPGFSRQRAELTTPQPEDFNPGQIGRGVDVSAIRRVVDSLTDERLRASGTESNRLSTLKENLKTVELVFNEPGENGLAGETNRLFSVLQDLSNNPESSALRSAAVQEISTWASNLNDLGNRLESLRQDLRTTVVDQVDAVNRLGAEIASLNQAIRTQVLGGNSPNDLMDRRDSLVNELSGYLDLRVRNNATDGSVQIDAAGVSLVGSGSANTLKVEYDTSGQASVLTPTGGLLRPTGGSIAALNELDRDTIPGFISQLDTLASTMAKRMNQLQATGTSQAQKATSFQSFYTVPTALINENLDSGQLAQLSENANGIPTAYQPSFTDDNGNSLARNLTINLRNTTTGEARKYELRYDPNSGTGTRSMNDLVQAINTGSGGGFTVIPSDGIGIPGLSAKAVSVGGGYQFQMVADSGYSIDFSPALDLKPTQQQWAGQAVSVSVLPPQAPAFTPNTIPSSVGSHLQFQVEDAGGGSQLLRITSRNASDGSSVSWNTVTLPATGGVQVSIGSGTLVVTAAAGTYRTGDRFTIDIDSSGAVVQNSGTPGLFTLSNQTDAAAAGVSIRGRYTGSLGLTDNASGTPPYTQWSMKVVSGGTIGAATPKLAGDPTPPVVEFSYWSGQSGAPTLQTVRKTLDSTLPAGTPVQIADGVYAVFDQGTLTQTSAGNDAYFTVDAQPDQAGLLPALGIGGIFTGSTASGLRMNAQLAADPTQLNVSTTRSEGDNTNLLSMVASRKEKLFNDGVFTLDDYYNSTLSEVGVRIQQADRLSQNQDSIKASLENRRQQISGVNIDEEVGNLILQQQAYTAAAKVISFARENIQTLLDLVR